MLAVANNAVIVVRRRKARGLREGLPLEGKLPRGDVLMQSRRVVGQPLEVHLELGRALDPPLSWLKHNETALIVELREALTSDGHRCRRRRLTGEQRRFVGDLFPVSGQ